MSTSRDPRPRNPRRLGAGGGPEYRPWGRLDNPPVTLIRDFGRAKVRLVVYPPGLDRGRAALLHAWGFLTSWWGLLAGVGLFLLTALPLAYARPWNIVVAPLLYGIVVLTIERATHEYRAQSRNIVWRVTRANANDGPPAVMREVADMLYPLTDATEPVEYRYVWHSAYDLVGDAHH